MVASYKYCQRSKKSNKWLTNSESRS